VRAWVGVRGVKGIDGVWGGRYIGYGYQCMDSMCMIGFLSGRLTDIDVCLPLLGT